MTATLHAIKPMLARDYCGQDVKGWMMSEKLDGVRAIWDGENLISRNGNIFAAPASFLAALPAGIPLDGELFIARGAFQATVSAVRKKSPVAAEWSGITYRVFEAPFASGDFSNRLAYAAAAIAGSTVATLVPHIECRGTHHMETFFADLCAAGAEGIMLRAPRSAYESRRSPSLLKCKPYDSAEAVMVGSEPGDGKFTGMAGALILNWKGIVFRVGNGISEEIRLNPPRIGAPITFGFCGTTDSGTPRFPTFLAERSYE
jgi:DNA ligase-1